VGRVTACGASLCMYNLQRLGHEINTAQLFGDLKQECSTVTAVERTQEYLPRTAFWRIISGVTSMAKIPGELKYSRCNCYVTTFWRIISGVTSMAKE
jgi:hypothetical protein